MKMVPYEAFACSCEAGDVVLRESYQPKTRGKLYYTYPKSKKNYYGCKFFLWKEERVALLINSPGGSSTPSFSPRISSTPISSPTPSTPPIYYGGSSSNTECSNCKHLLGSIKTAGQSSGANDSLKDIRDKNGDDAFVIIRDRKVPISEGTSLYAQFRSWLKTGLLVENQVDIGSQNTPDLWIPKASYCSRKMIVLLC
nr:putative proline-rich family protein [Tanacetum cinerariifolium]